MAEQKKGERTATVAVVDTETTGLSYEQGDRVVEFGALILHIPEDNSRKMITLARFSGLCRPRGVDLHGERALSAQKIHKIPTPSIEAAPDGDLVGLTVRQNFQLYCVSSITSYNTDFDFKFLVHDPWAISPAPGDSMRGGSNMMFAAPCIMEAARAYVNANPEAEDWASMGEKGVSIRTDGSFGCPSLDVMCEHFGIRGIRGHRALEDATRAAAVAAKLRSRGFWSPFGVEI